MLSLRKNLDDRIKRLEREVEQLREAVDDEADHEN